ncbi:MAG: hypothetical protein R3Y35_12390 [Clostridia bacterium]
MKKYNITVANDRALITTPFNRNFIKKIKGIGSAKWNGSQWDVPEYAIDIVREFMQEVYGETDIFSCEKIDLGITLKEAISEYRAGIELFGKSICHAYGRDSGAKISEDVILKTGKMASGGSAKWWTTEIEKGTTFILKNVALDIYEKTKISDNIEVVILNDKK